MIGGYAWLTSAARALMAARVERFKWAVRWFVPPCSVIDWNDDGEDDARAEQSY